MIRDKEIWTLQEESAEKADWTNIIWGFPMESNRSDEERNDIFTPMLSSGWKMPEKIV